MEKTYCLKCFHTDKVELDNGVRVIKKVDKKAICMTCGDEVGVFI